MTEGMAACSSNRAGAAWTPRKTADVVFLRAPAIERANSRLGAPVSACRAVVRESAALIGERASVREGGWYTAIPVVRGVMIPPA